MQKYIFRGIRLDTGEWVASSTIVRFNPENGEDLCYIPVLNDRCTCTHDKADNIISFDRVTFYRVDPESVSQFTGLVDRFGTNIFGGDIVRHYNRSDDPNAFTLGVIKWNSDLCRWENHNVDGSIYCVSTTCDYAVIGYMANCKTIWEALE